MRLPVLLTISILVSSASGCGQDPDDGAGGADNTPDPYADVTFEGGTTREALEALLEDQAVSDTERAAWMTLPADGTELPGDTPAKFGWRVGPPSPEQRRLDPTWLLGTRAEELPDLRAQLGPRWKARKASSKLNGPGYLFLIADAQGVDIHRAFTTALEHTPSLEAWTQVATHEPPFEACVVSGTFEDDVLVDGPWDGPWIAFTIAQ